ncbi:cytochrome c biogenesis protein [Micromonospora pattaloongensis]|uniref:Cytochrome c biogenesis protein n=1 Tax=Micromonospora pattaloongensis TaxID=405436 RepID=A0A1H3SGU6_9ACTN|nr:cytochrome c biogenesis protein ResB [Micromonospora pattaloongensis]SDZ36815.1 cytochrome c biogenesis protein [Micromonospora pattaloongensis]
MSQVDERTAPPAAPPTRRRANWAVALPRNAWRQLTSMRTALVLLFLLAVAAIPGSVLPQRSVNVDQVNAYYDRHPKLAPVLERLGGFEVFASPWFSAIYLLLFTSLVGCILPRLRDHLRALRSAPPDAPRRLDRLPQHAVLPGHDGDLSAIAAELRRQRWRVVAREGTVSAEKGHFKETGNLLFHLSLIGVLVGVGLGSWYGWHGNRLLVAGSDHAFCNTLQQYDEYGLGPRLHPTDLPPFCLELTDFEAKFLDSGQPDSYRATVNVDEAGGAPRRESFSVNSPLRLDGANVYLLGHGYAPVIRYTDRYGRSQTSVVPFPESDATMTSQGVAMFPDANVDPKTGERDPSLQMGFQGLYLPTTPTDTFEARSLHPAERNPGLLLVAYRGDLGLGTGIPSSVYVLNQRQIDDGKLEEVGRSKVLRKGDTWTLGDDTKVEFLGTRPFAVLSVRHDPGEMIVLVSAGVLLTGLMMSLAGRRRRVWFRVTPAGDSTTASSRLVEAGGLPRTDYPGFADEFAALVAAVTGGEPAAERSANGRGQRDRPEPREGTD